MREPAGGECLSALLKTRWASTLSGDIFNPSRQLKDVAPQRDYVARKGKIYNRFKKKTRKTTCGPKILGQDCGSRFPDHQTRKHFPQSSLSIITGQGVYSVKTKYTSVHALNSRKEKVNLLSVGRYAEGLSDTVVA